jgi:hypothetical protein
MYDSREGWTMDEQLAYECEYDAYLDAQEEDELDPSGGYEDDGDDGQPSEYTEWQDYMGGDDWDHGQYDEY